MTWNFDNLMIMENSIAQWLEQKLLQKINCKILFDNLRAIDNPIT